MDIVYEEYAKELSRLEKAYLDARGVYLHEKYKMDWIEKDFGTDIDFKLARTNSIRDHIDISIEKNYVLKRQLEVVNNAYEKLKITAKNLQNHYDITPEKFVGL